LHGSVRIFASLSVLSEFLPDDVGTFLAKNPTLRVSLEERVSLEIVRGVKEGAVDFGVCWNAGDLGGLATVGYRRDQLCVAMFAKHPLARRKRLCFAETLEFEHIEIQSGSIVQATLQRAAALANQPLRQRIQVSTFDAACRNVAAGLGIAVVPREAVGAFVKAFDLALVPLGDSWAVRRFVICMRSRDSLTATARLLVEYAAPARGRKNVRSMLAPRTLLHRRLPILGPEVHDKGADRVSGLCLSRVGSEPS